MSPEGNFHCEELVESESKSEIFSAEMRRRLHHASDSETTGHRRNGQTDRGHVLKLDPRVLDPRVRDRVGANGSDCPQKCPYTGLFKCDLSCCVHVS